jgi:hypothetical protein
LFLLIRAMKYPTACCLGQQHASHLRNKYLPLPSLIESVLTVVSVSQSPIIWVSPWISHHFSGKIFLSQFFSMKSQKRSRKCVSKRKASLSNKNMRTGPFSRYTQMYCTALLISHEYRPSKSENKVPRAIFSAQSIGDIWKRLQKRRNKVFSIIVVASRSFFRYIWMFRKALVAEHSSE